jgi:hypothetical protein
MQAQEITSFDLTTTPNQDKVFSLEEIRFHPLYDSGINKSIDGFYKPINDFGFFCKLELKQEQQSIIPIRFRLGTLDYVNKYERKN